MNPIEEFWQRVGIEAVETTKTGFLGFTGAFNNEGIPYLVVCRTAEDLERLLTAIHGDNLDPTAFKEVLILHVTNRKQRGILQ